MPPAAPTTRSATSRSASTRLSVHPASPALRRQRPAPQPWGSRRCRRKPPALLPSSTASRMIPRTWRPPAIGWSASEISNSMFKVLVGIIVAFLLSCGVALAQTVHLVGDSISRGYALGSFSDTIVPSHPLYVFRSIWTEANAVLAENGVAVRFVYGNTGMGDSTAPARLAARVASGMIGAKDIVIFEDAGDTSMDPDQYQGELEALIDAVAPAKVYVMTMFDYSPAPLNSQFDTPFVGGSGGGTRTINDAIRAAAAVKGASVIDMNAEMDAFQAYMAGQTL